MKKSRFTEEQIAFALRQAETGTKVSEVCRKMGVAEATFYNWKKKYGGLGVSELRRLKQLVADLSLDKQMLQDVVTKKALKPAHKRNLAEHLDGSYRVGMRRACRVVKIGRSTYYYRSVRDDRALRQRILEIAEVRE